MRPLDELREALESKAYRNCRIGEGRAVQWYDVVDEFDAFILAHPGLFDATVICCNCETPLDESDGLHPASLFMSEQELYDLWTHGDHAEWSGLYICPACAKEAIA